MSSLIPEGADTEQVTAEPRRDVAARLMVLDAIDAIGGDVDPMSHGSGWDLYFPDGETDDEKRANALAWLARHAKLIQRVGRKVGIPAQKFSNDAHGFGVEVRGYDEAGGFVWLYAAVPASLTCEMVPTGEVEHIPAKDVPVMKKVCPESIYAGIESEATEMVASRG